MPRKLKLWNGRWYPFRGQHAYVATYSRADAVRLINEACGAGTVSLGEIRDYWNDDAWGTRMKGITPERGLWITESYADAPKRIA